MFNPKSLSLVYLVPFVPFVVKDVVLTLVNGLKTQYDFGHSRLNQWPPLKRFEPYSLYEASHKG